jgi:Aspartyl protease
VTSPAERYPFVERDPRLGVASLAPLLPVQLVGANAVSAVGLLDTGATVNVLPYALGEQLGLVWDQQSIPVTLSGNLAASEGRAVVVSAVVGNFSPVRLAFAWARTDDVPVLLGQVNFFMEFDVCFFRSRSVFEVRPKQVAGRPL